MSARNTRVAVHTARNTRVAVHTARNTRALYCAVFACILQWIFAVICLQCKLQWILQCIFPAILPAILAQGRHTQISPGAGTRVPAAQTISLSEKLAKGQFKCHERVMTLMTPFGDTGVTSLGSVTHIGESHKHNDTFK